MSKLIRTPSECAHNFKNICFYEPNHIKSCIPKNDENFPKYCPLEEGVTKEHHEHMIESLRLLIRTDDDRYHGKI
jgi:hypothetical protein